jgi:hypothetical protein
MAPRWRPRPNAEFLLQLGAETCVVEAADHTGVEPLSLGGTHHVQQLRGGERFIRVVLEVAGARAERPNLDLGVRSPHTFQFLGHVPIERVGADGIDPENLLISPLGLLTKKSTSNV